MKGHYRLIPGRVGPSSKPLEQDQKQTSDPQNRCLSHPINQQQRSSFITDPLSSSVFLLRSRPSSELWARHCFFFFFFLHLWLLCACSKLPWAPGLFLLDMLNRSKEQGELVAETETRSAVFVARRPSVRARMASCPFDDPPSWWMVKKCVPDQKIVTRWEGDGGEAYEVPLPVEVQSFLAMLSLFIAQERLHKSIRYPSFSAWISLLHPLSCAIERTWALEYRVT